MAPTPHWGLPGTPLGEPRGSCFKLDINHSKDPSPNVEMKSHICGAFHNSCIMNTIQLQIGFDRNTGFFRQEVTARLRRPSVRELPAVIKLIWACQCFLEVWNRRNQLSLFKWGYVHTWSVVAVVDQGRWRQKAGWTCWCCRGCLCRSVP